MSSRTTLLEIRIKQWRKFMDTAIVPLGCTDIRHYHTTTRKALMALKSKRKVLDASFGGMVYTGLFCLMVDQIRQGTGPTITATELALKASKCGLHSYPLENLRELLEEINYNG